MVEAFTVLFIGFVALGIYIGAWAFTRGRTATEQAAEQVRLRAHRDELQARIESARRAGWDRVLLNQLEDRLAGVEARLRVEA